MVVRLVSHGDLLRPDLSEQLSVHAMSRRGGRRHGVILKYLPQVVEQLGGRQERIGAVVVMEVLQEELGVLVSLGCRFPEPAVRLLSITSHILSGEVQLAQGVLRILVALLGGIG